MTSIFGQIRRNRFFVTKEGIGDRKGEYDVSSFDKLRSFRWYSWDEILKVRSIESK